LFFGQHPASEPADPRKHTADPLLNNPGGAGQGIASAIAAYTLRGGSPARNLGCAYPTQIVGTSDAHAEAMHRPMRSRAGSPGWPLSCQERSIRT
jgi:hypothetical protein